MAADRTLPILLLAIPSLLSCGQQGGPGPEIHDTKYVALDDRGKELAELPGQWNCVLDRYTGLTWEVKSDQQGLHHHGNTYSWFDPGQPRDAELDYRGTPGAGDCSGSACDTFAFVEAVNAEGLCGFRDWRLASRDELGSISDPRRMQSPPTVNTDYFPFTQAGEYWSADPYRFQWNAAWLWNYHYGHDRVEWKASPRFARLVRGQADQLQRVKD